jgi:phospholipase/carboxylesterase
MREDVLGGLRVRITGGTDRDGGGKGPVIVLLHGFGAPGDDLVSLWRTLRVPEGTRFVFPEAPVELGPGYMGGRAWWMIDIGALERAVQRGEVRDLSNDTPPGLEAARTSVVKMLQELDVKLTPSRLVLGGFSQGAMLSCDVALRADIKLDGLVLLSGTLIAAREWAPLMAKRSGLRVLQSHGREDPLLPFSIAERLRDELRAANIDVQWVPFTGGHAIPPKVLEELGEFLGNVLS